MSHLGIECPSVFSLPPVQFVNLAADGMCAERILIPTHAEGYETIQQRAASPDAFINAKIAEFAGGNSGLPGR